MALTERTPTDMESLYEAIFNQRDMMIKRIGIEPTKLIISTNDYSLMIRSNRSLIDVKENKPFTFLGMKIVESISGQADGEPLVAVEW